MVRFCNVALLQQHCLEELDPNNPRFWSPAPHVWPVECDRTMLPGSWLRPRKVFSDSEQTLSFDQLCLRYMLSACMHLQDTNRVDEECGSQLPQEDGQAQGQAQEDQENQLDEQQADLRQSGRKRKLSPRAAEAAAAAAAAAAADPEHAEIAAEVHAVAGAGGAPAAGAGAGAECMSSQKRTVTSSAQKPKTKRQKTGAAAGDGSGWEGADMRCGNVLADADMHGMHACARAAGMMTRGHRSVLDPPQVLLLPMPCMQSESAGCLLQFPAPYCRPCMSSLVCCVTHVLQGFCDLPVRRSS